MKHLIRVGVLRGGPSNEYEISLATGAVVLDVLRTRFESKYQAIDIFIDKRGVWHIDGVPVKPEDALRRVDMVFNALHGTYGEDGKIQALLEAHGIPFTGSNSFPSAVSMNKIMAKRMFKEHGIKSPYFKEFASTDIKAAIDQDPQKLTTSLFESVLLPAVVKPVSSGSSVGITIVREYSQFLDALTEAAKHDDKIMIEEFVPGIEIACVVIDGFRNHEVYVLPPIEIRSKTSRGFFDVDAKYKGNSEDIVPATISDKLKKEIEELSKKIHRGLGLRHYSRSDFIIHPRRGIYVLEVNTLPGLTPESLIPKALRAVGSDTHEVIEHLILLALGE